VENTGNLEIIKITVTNNIGQTIYETANFQSGELTLPNATTGIYFVTISLNDTVITEKIVVD
jgi:hypothetical protein